MEWKELKRQSQEQPQCRAVEEAMRQSKIEGGKLLVTKELDALSEEVEMAVFAKYVFGGGLKNREESKVYAEKLITDFLLPYIPELQVAETATALLDKLKREHLQRFPEDDPHDEA